MIFSMFFMGVGINLNAESVFAEVKNFSVLEDDNYMLSDDYLNFYSVSNNFFTYENNGGELSGYELSKAFDRNLKTSFKSSQDNNVNYVDSETGETKKNFINTIDVTFSKEYSLDRIFYSSEFGTTRGYPIQLNLYYDCGSGFELIDSYLTDETTKFVEFKFGEILKIQKFRFEYVTVSTRHKYVATAREIIFLQPDDGSLNEMNNLFSDYACTKLNQKYNSYNKINELEEKIKEKDIYSEVSSVFERARNIIDGSLSFDSKREFSTDQSAKNVIAQDGDLAGYCRNTLLNSSFGTNRQVTGILSNAGEVVTIYVDADESDPLPKIRFSQHVGSWRKWMSGELQLKRGKNTFTTPNFEYSDYTVDVPLGGPIYICNPYTSENQSANVKIYIEGGDFYPVYSKDKDENEYLSELNEYAEKVRENPNIVDVTEIVMDHIIVTAYATKGNEFYSTYTPKTTIENWNAYMDKLLEFGGITQDRTNPIFDEKNLKIKLNIRVCQPWSGAAMYAYTEFVGVYESAQNALFSGAGLGWGISHEIGHTLDTQGRIVSECSNNMYSKYNETAIEQQNSRGDFAKTLQALASDLTYADTSYFNSNRYNFLIWWYIESWHNGYWANLENCYRGLYPELKEFLATDSSLKDKIDGLTATEKQVFYSSIATGVDLSYYFDRWGYSLTNSDTDPIFKTETSSASFQELISLAVEKEFVDNSKQYKLWYQNNMAYHNKNFTPSYSSAMEVNIKSVTKTADGYNIFIGESKDENHLGYEILQGNDEDGYKVIGFTYSGAFIDTYNYSDEYIPSYKVVAVDNTFNETKAGPAKSYTESTEVVCKIGENNYTSLRSAVESADVDDVIEMIASSEEINIIISKNLTIKLAEGVNKNIVISKISDGDLITVSSGVTLNICGEEKYKIELDGNSFSQSGCLLKIAGVVNASNLILKNNISTNSGAICLNAGSKNSTFANCIITDNTSKKGSAFHSDNANTSIIFTNVQILNNKSTDYGTITNKGTMTFNNCLISGNQSKTGTIYNYDGGVIYVNDSIIKSNIADIGGGFHINGYTSIKGCEISENISSTASAIYYSTTVNARQIIIENTTIKNNKASDDKSLSINGGIITLNKVVLEEKEIHLLSGTMYIDSESNFKTNFNIKNGVDLILKSDIFNNIENCKFSLLDYISGMKILSAGNFDLTERDLEKIKIVGESKFLDLIDNSIKAFSHKVILTLDFAGDKSDIEYKYGDEVVLNFDKLQTKYAVKFIDDNGREYQYNEKIRIKNDLTLTASLADKIKIIFDFGETQTTYYLCPNSLIEIPSKEYENKKLKYWSSGDIKYNIGDKITAQSNLTLTAEYEQLYKLTLKDGDNIVFEKYYEYGSEINLAEIYDNKKISCWEEKGNQISGQTYIIKNDVTLTAKYKSNTTLIVSVVLSAVVVAVLIIVVEIIRRKKKLKK